MAIRPQLPQLSQSSIIAGSLFFAFLVFITSKGELGTYLSLLGIGYTPPAPSTAQKAEAAGPSQQASYDENEGNNSTTGALAAGLTGATASPGAGGMSDPTDGGMLSSLGSFG